MVLGLGGGSLGSLIVSIDADLTKLDRGLRTTSSRIQNASRKFTASTDRIGRGITRMGLITSAGFALTAKASIDFESAFAGVRKTVDASEEEFEALEKNFRNLSKEIPSTAVELAGIGEIAGQLGIEGVNNLTKFTKTIAQIEATTNLTRDNAATSFARIANVIKEPIGNIDRMGASVVELGNNFATTEVEILNFATRIAGVGQVVGLSSADLFAIGTAFSSVGVRAERGGTAVSKSFIKIIDAINEGGAELELFAELAGQTTDEFVKGFEEDAARSFALFIEGLKKEGKKGAAILQDLELGDQRLVQAFLSVGGASGILTDALETSRLAFEENAALQIEFDKRLATTGAQLKITWNNVLDLAITIGDALLPSINAFLKGVKPVVDVIGEWISNNQELFNTIVTVAAKIGLFALAIGPAIIAIGKISAVIIFLVASPIGLLISAMAALTLAWSTDWLNIRQITAAVAAGLGDIIDSIRKQVLRLSLVLQNLSEIPLKERLLNPIDSIKDATRKADEAIQALEEQQGPLSEFGETFLNVVTDAGQKTEEFTDKVTRAKEELGNLFNEINKAVSVETKEGEKKQTPEERLAQRKKLRKDDLKDKEKNDKALQASESKNLTLLDVIKGKFRSKDLDNEKKKKDIQEELWFSADDTLTSILTKQAENSKVAAILLQVRSIAKAIVNTSVGVTSALATGNIPLAAVIGVLGAAEVATIAGVKFREGSTNVPFRGITDPGEIVIPENFADGIRRGKLSLAGPEGVQGGGGGRTIINNVNFESITLSNDLEVETLMERFGEEIQRRSRGA